MKEDSFIRQARKNLRREGIVILDGSDDHAKIAKALGVAVPEKGEWISVRLVPAENSGDKVANIDGGLWRVAGSDDPVVDAPILPDS